MNPNPKFELLTTIELLQKKLEDYKSHERYQFERDLAAMVSAYDYIIELENKLKEL